MSSNKHNRCANISKIFHQGGIVFTAFQRCFITLLFVAAVLKGSPVGTVAGTIKDPAGASIANAKVTLTNLSTNAESNSTSDSQGAFQFLQLAPGNYSVSVQAAGFKTATIKNAIVEVDQITRADFSLTLGAVSDSIEVSSATPLLETDKTSLGSVVEQNTIAAMPLNARQFLDLALITPGTAPAGAGVQGAGFNAAGARSQSNVFFLDGVSNTDTQTNQPLTNFRITDAVQEFNVTTSVALPEFGRSTGAEVNIVTKSGGNQVHGSVFEYFRNTKLNAADFFSNALGAPKSPFNRNQFGATIGGPIIRNRTFFFLSYEGFLQSAPTVSATRVPTAADRALVTDPISQKLLQFWPTPNASGTNNYISNVASADKDHTGLMKIDHTFSPQDSLAFRWTEFRGNLIYPGTLPTTGGNEDNPVQRSLSLNETHTLSPTFLNEFRAGYSRNLTMRTVQDANVNAASIFTDASGNPLPGAVNSTTDPLHAGLPTITIGGGYAVLGATSSYPQGRISQTTELFDNMSKVSGKHSFRWGFHVRREDLRRYAEANSRGAFTFNTWAQFAAGQLQASTIRTGSTLAYWRRYPWDLYWQDTFKIKENFTLNYGVRYEYPSNIAEIRDHAANFLPGIGLVIGGTNELVTINPALSGRAALVLQQAPLTLPQSGVYSDKHELAPMVGFAYTPRFADGFFGKDSTVIRGGFRVAYDDLFNNAPSNMVNGPPYTLATTQTANVTQPGVFPWSVGFNQNVPLVSNYGKQGPGTPTSGTIALTAVDPHLENAYVYQYNLGIQRKIGNGFSFEADYQGNTGHRLPIFIDLNQPQVIVNNPNVRGPLAPNQQIFPYPTWGKIMETKSISSSDYNGLVTTAKYQGKGSFVQLSYTFSKSLDYNSALYGSNGLLGEAGNPADSTNLKLEHGPSSFDVRNRFVGVYVQDVPIGPGHRLMGWNNGISRQAFGGWQISGVTTLQGGTPFTVESGGADSNGFNQFDIGNASQSDNRPNIVCNNGISQNNSNPSAAFSTACFTPALAGKVGTSGRDQFYGPSLLNWDFATLKTFPINERFKLSFRSDFFNLFNHTNFANPIAYTNNANFGKITQTLGTAVATNVGTTGGPVGGPRLIQLALRLQF